MVPSRIKRNASKLSTASCPTYEWSMTFELALPTHLVTPAFSCLFHRISALYFSAPENPGENILLIWVNIILQLHNSVLARIRIRTLIFYTILVTSLETTNCIIQTEFGSLEVHIKHNGILLCDYVIFVPH